MKFDPSRRRSSAGFVFAAGAAAAAVATAPAVSAAPTTGLFKEGYSFGRRGSEPNLQVPSTRSGPPAKSAGPAIRRSSDFDFETTGRLFPKRDLRRVLHARQGGCLDSSANEDDINTLLWGGGDNVKIALCPGAVITINGPISFSNANQEIYTVGYPTDNTRAKIVVAGEDQDCAIWMNCDRCTNTAIRNIAVDGSRPGLGRYGTSGLIEMGGNAKYQVLDGCDISNPRGWTAVHVAEGWQDSCSSQIITNNEIGPCGTSPNTAQQFSVVMTKFREFMSTPKRWLAERQVSAPGQWADGISVACRNTTVTGNTVTGATDGGIVLFGAPDSTIMNNTIIAKGNTLLGGINLVDHGPFNGDYTGTVVSGNTIIADDAMIKVGVAVGLLAWGDYNSSDYRTTGGVIEDNTFIANGGSGYFGYGTAVGGNDGAVVNGNNYSGALFGGTTSYACQNGKTPPPQASIWDPYTTTGGSYQPNVTSLVDFNFLICTMPCQYSSTCAANMTLVKGPSYTPPQTNNTTTSTTVLTGTSTATAGAGSNVTASATITSGSQSTGLNTTRIGTIATGASTTALNSTLTGKTSTLATATGTPTRIANSTTVLVTGTTSTTGRPNSTAIISSTGTSANTTRPAATSSGIIGAVNTTVLATTTGKTTTALNTTILSSTTLGSTSRNTTSTALLTSTSKTSTVLSTTKTSTSVVTSSKLPTSTTVASPVKPSSAPPKPTVSPPAPSPPSPPKPPKVKPDLALTRGGPAKVAAIPSPVKVTTTSKKPTSTTTKKVTTTSTTKKVTSTSTKKATTSTAKTTSSKILAVQKPTSTKKATSTSIKVAATTSKKPTSTTSKKPTSTTTKKVTSTTTKKATSTTTKKAATTTSKKPTTTSKKVTSTTSKKTSSTATVKVATATTKPKLALVRGAIKRGLDEAVEPTPSLRPRKRASEDVEDIEARLMYLQDTLSSLHLAEDREVVLQEVDALERRLVVYRDWILPGAVRTPRAKRSLVDEEAFDKRDILADATYWE